MADTNTPDSRLLYSAAMSLDGFIAGVDGDMSWLSEHLVRSSPEVDDLMRSIGAVNLAKEAAGGRYVNVLGATVAKQCLEAGVLHEVLVLIAPVLLGDGVRLFDYPGGTNIALDPINPNSNEPLSLWYRVRTG